MTDMSYSKSDILNALGIETEARWWTSAFIGFGVGCAVGAAVAMLIAPKSGRELRQDIVDRGRDLMHRGREQFGMRPEEGLPKNPAPTY
jgi:hypothetical protein